MFRWNLLCVASLVLLGGCDPAASYIATSRQDEQRYEREYHHWLDAGTEDVVRKLIAVRGREFSARPPSTLRGRVVPGAEALDPTLSFLAAHPELMAALDLQLPFAPDESVHGLIYNNPCGSVERDWSKAGEVYVKGHISVHPMAVRLKTADARLIPCSDLDRALVVREGNRWGGDWLLLLPDSAPCRWFYGSVCAQSLKGWFAASIAGLESNWETMHAFDARVVETLRTQPRLDLQHAVDEVVRRGPIIGPLEGPRESELGVRAGAKLGDVRVQPRADYQSVLEQLGRRPRTVLPMDQTYEDPLAGPCLVLLWNGRSFEALRLRPHDYLHAIVVVRADSAPRLRQVTGDLGTIYVGDHNRAFLRFADWVDYWRAHYRLVERNAWPFLPSAVSYPIG